MKRKSTIKKLMLTAAVISISFLNGKSQALYEGFDDITLLPGLGWEEFNMSNPIGTEGWVQGYTPTANQTYYFTSNTGCDSCFISSSFQSATGTGTISNWLLTPALTINNGDTLSFYTRTADAGGVGPYPDRMQVRMNQTTTNNIGTDEFSVGDFTDLLLDINPNYTVTDYPVAWTKYDLVIAGVPAGGVSGRFAFRYFVENGGPTGANSFIIGIDDAAYNPLPVGVPEIKNTYATFIGPNPVVNYMKIQLSEPLKSNATLKVLNSIGQVAYTVDLAKGFRTEDLNLSSLANGYYNIFISGNDINIRKSLVKE